MVFDDAPFDRRQRDDSQLTLGQVLLAGKRLVASNKYVNATNFGCL
jgi:hypothetical protein